jgi:hypothetical protein
MQRRDRQVGIEAMAAFYDSYEQLSAGAGVGFFQIGGGIAGDFPICVVPSVKYDLERPVRPWAYFCQISDSTTVVRLVLRSDAEREDHLGQADGRDADVRHRVGRHDRRAADARRAARMPPVIRPPRGR